MKSLFVPGLGDSDKNCFLHIGCALQGHVHGRYFQCWTPVNQPFQNWARTTPTYPNPNAELLAVGSSNQDGFGQHSGKAGHSWGLAEETQLLGRKLWGALLSSVQSSVFPFRDPGLNAAPKSSLTLQRATCLFSWEGITPEALEWKWFLSSAAQILSHGQGWRWRKVEALSNQLQGHIQVLKHKQDLEGSLSQPHIIFLWPSALCCSSPLLSWHSPVLSACSPCQEKPN